jgi:hypothetical protein
MSISQLLDKPIDNSIESVENSNVDQPRLIERKFRKPIHEPGLIEMKHKRSLAQLGLDGNRNRPEEEQKKFD